MSSTPKVPHIILMVSGVVAFIFSFFAFVGASGSYGITKNSWTFGPSLWLPVIGIIIAALAAIQAFSPQTKLPGDVLGFTLTQVIVILAAASLLISVGYLFISVEGLGKKFGFYLELLASIGLIVGAAMALLEEQKGGTGRVGGGYGQPQQPPTPF